MAALRHELWLESTGERIFCLAGPMGERARRLMTADATLTWTVTANSHFEAMTKYYSFMGWGAYTTDHDWDYHPYPTVWLEMQVVGQA